MSTPQLDTRFHLAFPVNDIPATRQFYVDILGCREGRSAERWIDFDFYGHQISAHLVDEMDSAATNAVDGDAVPTRHFGCILPWDKWESLSERLQTAVADGITRFIIEPKIRFKGESGEQATMFVTDPSGNALEFKSFRDDAQVFA
ncbi:MAG: VOC family protein [Alphaproteobacteria bacterium]|nr:VOC family protein [Alphaproteobacteria bacterium SS10]